MSLEIEVQEIETSLAELLTRLNAFEQRARTTISNDQSKMLDDLRSSVNSVQETVSLLENRNAGLLTYFTANRNPALSTVVVVKQATSLESNFKKLRNTTDSGLANIKRLNTECHDFDVELESIRAELSALNTRTWRSLGAAKTQLESKQSEATDAKSSVATLKTSLGELERKMENEKENRNIMRVARVAAWTTTLFFPPAALVAGGLEGAAIAMRSDRKKLQERINEATTLSNSLDKQVSELERQKASLDTAVSTARSLWCKVENIECSTDPVKRQVKESMEEFQALKTTTDDFSQWSASMHDQADTMSTLCDDEESLRRMTGRMLKTLQDAEHDSIKAICAPLRTLKCT